MIRGNMILFFYGAVQSDINQVRRPITKSKIYRYTGLTFSTDGLSPVNDPKWIDITTWRKIDFEPVQTIKEFRTATQSYNFTVDSNLDPFIAIEVTSENGYGQTYTSKKNYELRGLKDLTDGVMLIEADPLPRRLQAPAPPPPPPPVKLPPTDLLYTPTFTSRTFGVGTSPIPSINADGLTPTYEILQITYNGVTMSSATAISISAQTGQITFNYPRYTSDSLDYGTHSVLVRATTVAGSVTQSHNIIVNEVPTLNQLSNQTIVSTTQLGNMTISNSGAGLYTINKQKIDFSSFTASSLPISIPFAFSRRISLNQNNLFATAFRQLSPGNNVNTIYRYQITNQNSLTIETSTYSFWTLNSPELNVFDMATAISSLKSAAICPQRATNSNEVLVSWGGGKVYSIDLSSNIYGTIQNSQILLFLDIGPIQFKYSDNPSKNRNYSVSSMLYIGNKLYALCVSGFNSVLVEMQIFGTNNYQRTRTIWLSGNWEFPTGDPYKIKQVPGGGYTTQFPVLNSSSPLYVADSLISIGNSQISNNTIYDNIYVYFRNPQSTIDTPLLYKLSLETNNSGIELVRDIVQLGISPANISPFLNP